MLWSDKQIDKLIKALHA